MSTKLVTGLIGLLLVLGFLAVPVIKLKDTALAIIVLIGVVMVVYEFIETLRSRDD
jgi:hypothetical protein